jgi:eukaryotic-like serine/threonine-protein kinase
MNGLTELVREIHRRSLWQVLGIFLAASWGVLQVVEVLTETAGLPDWTPTMALVLLLIGLPMCLATAFVQEGMPGRSEEDAGGAAVPASPDPHGAPVGSLSPGTGSPDRPSQRSATKNRLFTWRNALLGGVGALALLGFSLLAYFAMWTTGIGPVGNLVAQGVIEERDPVILAEFENRTSDETLGTIVTDALRVDLLSSQVLTIVDERLIDDALRRMGLDASARLSAEVAREIAVREGIKAVIEGDVSSVGGGYLLAVRIVAPDGSVLAAFRETARTDAELLPTLDRLSQQLREKSGESLRTIRAGEPLEAVTTSSLEALRLYAQALQSVDEGDVTRTISLLEDAVALDSTFAMAWRKLAVQHSNRGNDYEAEVRAATAAYRHRNRLTERERYLAEAFYHSNVTLDDEARAEAYRRVLEIQPDDPVALNNLGLHYAGRNDWRRAADLYIRAVEGPGRSGSAYNNLVITLYNLGEKEGALVTLDEWETRYPKDLGMVLRRVRLAWGMGDLDAARATAREGLETLSDDPFAQFGLRQELARIEAAGGRLAASRELQLELRAMAERVGRPVEAFYAELAMGYLDLRAGGDTLEVIRRVERRFEEGLASVPDINRPHPELAVLWASVGRNAERAGFWAQQALESFPEEARTSSTYEEISLLIEGSLASLNGDHATALVNLEEVQRRQSCTDCYLSNMADVYARMGEPDSAIVYIERFLAADLFDFVPEREANTADRLAQLARLYESVGRPADAATAWTRYADRWTDADPVLQPLVARAREEAARLSGGQTASGGS